MNRSEAQKVLAEQLTLWRGRSYAALAAQIGICSHAEVRGPSGVEYQVDITPHWDDQPHGAIRVLGSVDSGGIRALAPLTDDFLIGPDGRSLDEQAV